MKYLPWLGMVLITGSTALAGCSDDSNDNSGGAGGGSGGTTSTAGKSSGTSGSTAAGSPSSSGGAPGSGGAPSSGGAGAATGGAGGALGGAGGQAAAKDIIDTAVAAGTFTQLAKALGDADLIDALKGDGPFTVFAPDDAAFEAFEEENPGTLASLDKETLATILKYHVVAGAGVKSTALVDEQVFTTLSGSPVLIDTTGGVKVGDGNVKTADIVASNGVIHVIDTIILPPEKDIVETAVAAGMFTSLAGALTAADLVDALKAPGPFTVFAPTDDAFDKLASVPTGDALKNVLLYHVVEGAVGSGDLKAGMVPTLLPNKSVTVNLTGGVKIDDAKVTTANIIAKNGVIHVVDTVLVPQ